MSRTVVRAPTSRLRLGHARADITPPVGIYHRMWGAARHDRPTGVHRPLLADVLALAPLADGSGGGGAPAAGAPGDAAGGGRVLLRAHLDLVGLPRHRHGALVAAIAGAAGVPEEDVVVAYSHTHSAGWLTDDRLPLPGGELIPPFLETLAERLAGAAREAVAALAPVTVTYATGRSAVGAERDYWDEGRGHFVCGLNPDPARPDVPGGGEPDGEPLVVARCTAEDGRTVATLVNYGCHPTTLAWENSLISPDFVGAMR